MSKSKHARMISQLGSQMAESAGGSITNDDRFSGFTPSDMASGEMALDRIMEDEHQPRKSYDEQSLKDLAENLKTHGVQQPIQLRWNQDHRKWMIVYGHRRFRAAQLAGLNAIPCTFTEADVDEPTIRIRQLVENAQREDLAPMELARAIESLASLTKWSNRRIAEALGFNHTTVGRYLSLLKLPEQVQQLVQNRDLAPCIAAEITKAKAEDQERLGRQIVAKGLNRDAAKQEIAQAICSPMAKPSQPKPKAKELLTQTVNITIYRNPDVSDFKIRQELMAVIEQMDTTKAES
ncbi:MAG: ParB/RepB/Spo0J family partition protein [Planctomycetales bacterium]|nr:ParB/RepB/Spo0J family partition protein [Planctomycetales bacterium]